MPEQMLLDNDVALKIACYSLVAEMVTTVAPKGDAFAILGVGRFVMRGKLDRTSRISNPAQAKAALEELLKLATLLEPDEEELAIAAELEAEASRHSLELDSGESQLLAILGQRACPLLITGDKRAVIAMATVATKLAANRILCLEQLMALIIDAAGPDTVRPRVCAEPSVDRAITACFGCARANISQEEINEGLASYIGHLDRSAPGILAKGFASSQAG